MKQYIADEAEKEKKELERKLEILEKDFKELKNANEVHEILKGATNKAQWALSVRKNQSLEE